MGRSPIALAVPARTSEQTTAFSWPCTCCTSLVLQFGKVYKGIWRGTIVAIKSMVLPKSAGLRKERMAIMEAAISSALMHPNVLQVCVKGRIADRACTGKLDNHLERRIAQGT